MQVYLLFVKFASSQYYNNESVGLPGCWLLRQGPQGRSRWPFLRRQEGKDTVMQIGLEFDCEEDSWEMQSVKK